MKRATIRQSILDAIDQTDEQIGRYPNKLLKWAKYIEREIGSLNGYKVKSQLFTVDGSYITLPDDCFKVVALFQGDWTDVENAQYRDVSDLPMKIDEITDDLIYAWMPEEAVYINPMAYEEIGDELHLINEYNDTEITLIYQYIETDEDGFWMVNESHLDAITKYLIYRIAYTLRWKVFKSEKMLRSGHIMMVKDLERDYNIAVRHARAEDGRESEFERAQY